MHLRQIEDIWKKVICNITTKCCLFCTCAFTLALVVRTRVRLTSEFGSFGSCDSVSFDPRAVPSPLKKSGLSGVRFAADVKAP